MRELNWESLMELNVYQLAVKEPPRWALILKQRPGGSCEVVMNGSSFY